MLPVLCASSFALVCQFLLHTLPHARVISSPRLGPTHDFFITTGPCTEEEKGIEPLHVRGKGNRALLLHRALVLPLLPHDMRIVQSRASPTSPADSGHLCRGRKDALPSDTGGCTAATVMWISTDHLCGVRDCRCLVGRCSRW